MLFQKMRSMLFLSFIGITLSACDSSGSGTSLFDASKDIVAPTVKSSFPESDSLDIEVDSLVRIVFSEEMDERSLVGDPSSAIPLPPGIQLYSGKEDQQADRAIEARPGQLSLSKQLGVGLDPVTGNKIDIDVTVAELRHASGRFALNTSYTVAVQVTAHDLADNPETSVNEANFLPGTVKFNFTTEEGEWKDAYFITHYKPDPVSSAPVLVEEAQYSPDLAVNAAGDVLAAWRQHNDGNNDSKGVWAGRYTANDEIWRASSVQTSPPVNIQRIDSVDGSDAFEPQIVMNSNGDAAVIWYQAPLSNGATSIWVSMFKENQWQPAENISENQSTGNEAHSPAIGIDDQGNIIAAWLESDGINERIKTRRYDQQAGWDTAPVTFGGNLSGDAKAPSLSMTSQGVAMLVWAQQVAGVDQVFSSRYLPGTNTGFSLAQRIDHAGNTGNARKPNIAIDANNDAFAIWQQSDGVKDSIWINRFSGAAWSGAELMETEQRGDAAEPNIVFGADNQAYAIWLQSIFGLQEVHVRPFSIGRDLVSDWGPIETISSGNSYSKPSISFDREGNAIAIWIEGFGESGKVVASRFSERLKNWSTTRVISNLSGATSNGGSAVIEPLLEDGRMLCVWSNFDGSNFRLASALFSD